MKANCPEIIEAACPAILVPALAGKPKLIDSPQIHPGAVVNVHQVARAGDELQNSLIIGAHSPMSLLECTPAPRDSPQKRFVPASLELALRCHGKRRWFREQPYPNGDRNHTSFAVSHP